MEAIRIDTCHIFYPKCVHAFSVLVRVQITEIHFRKKRVPNIENSRLICFENRLTNFNMMEAVVCNGSSPH